MTRATLVGVVLALGAVGCGSNGAGSAGEYLVSGLENRTDLYVAPGLETRPMTLAQLGEENAAIAIAVDVEVYDEVAIAFERDAAGNAIYSRDAIVGLWRVLDRNVTGVENVETIDGELENPTEGPVYVPGGTITVGRDGLPGPGLDQPGVFDNIDFGILLDTSIFDDARAWTDILTAHPGCA